MPPAAFPAVFSGVKDDPPRKRSSPSLIDRPIRPLFPNGFTNEVQIIVTVLSSETDIDPDIISLLGVSAAIAISGVPFNGPLGAARVGYKDGQYLLNPTLSQVAESDLDLVVAGTESAVPINQSCLQMNDLLSNEASASNAASRSSIYLRCSGWFCDSRISFSTAISGSLLIPRS